MERDHGRIVSVSTRTLGSVLDGDHAAGATSLVLFDAGDFDETGGTLSVNGATLAYASVDDDADTIALTDPLPADALDGDFVACWDTLYNVAVTKTTAMVQVDGDDDNPDPIECYVPRKIAEDLKPGDRGGPGEDCEIEYVEEDDEWRVSDVRGLSDQAGIKFATDIFTVTDAGDQAFTLSNEADPESLHLRWHPDGGAGVDWLDDEWSLNGAALTVPDPAGDIEGGDKFSAKYAYRRGFIAPRATVASGLIASTDGNGQIILPSDTPDGTLIVITAAVPSGASVTTNGYSVAAQTTEVTHSASGGFTYTYSMMVFAMIKPTGSSPVPVISGDKDCIWVASVWGNATGVQSAVTGTVADATSADTPAATPAHLRAWVALGNHPTITLEDPGTIAASHNIGADVCIVVATDAGDGAVTAGTQQSVAWCLATLTMEGLE